MHSQIRQSQLHHELRLSPNDGSNDSDLSTKAEAAAINSLVALRSSSSSTLTPQHHDQTSLQTAAALGHNVDEKVSSMTTLQGAVDGNLSMSRMFDQGDDCNKNDVSVNELSSLHPPQSPQHHHIAHHDHRHHDHHTHNREPYPSMIFTTVDIEPICPHENQNAIQFQGPHVHVDPHQDLSDADKSSINQIYHSSSTSTQHHSSTWKSQVEVPALGSKSSLSRDLLGAAQPALAPTPAPMMVASEASATSTGSAAICPVCSGPGRNPGNNLERCVIMIVHKLR